MPDYIRERAKGSFTGRCPVSRGLRILCPAGSILVIRRTRKSRGHLAENVSLKSVGDQVVEVKQMKEAIDPVCLMTVDIDTARFKTEYEGITYYFCAPGCLRTFEENPERFVA